ncbi:MAG: prepilin-type N-terminal cleavage/methylation domain-containing protein [Firmicutes bacterium]|nr:prepilin-type N-terminal cleavage/methylation domain-containing protein [Bacillota bacterium]
MKNFKSKLAEKAGFTLVELIVVIAILGILAGVAVPSYTGYINKAKETSDVQYLGVINTAAQGLAAGAADTVNGIEVIATGGDITSIKVDLVTGSDITDSADLKLLITGATDGDYEELTSEKYAKGATWSAGEWSAK